MFNLLAAIPFVGNLINWFSTKKRLACEYGLVLIVVIIGGFTVSQWITKAQLSSRLTTAENELQQVTSRLTVVEMVNDAHEQTIARLAQLRTDDSIALEGLLNDYKTLDLKDYELRRQLNDLRKRNQTVQSYLDEPVPAELVRLLHEGGTTGD